ncbi:MAG: hypothetical protein AAF696_27770 [Bacteroidota bacterium]
MSKKDKLHELIRTMSMAEKRRFTIDAAQNTSNKERKYILLFDVLVEMKEYTSDALIEVLKSHGYATQHLASDKNYLYNLIIKSLSSFYSGKNTSLNIKEKLHQVEILFERGLYEQCISILKKLENQAKKYDLYALMIEISSWKEKTYERLGEFGLALDELQNTLFNMAWLDNRMAFKKLIYQIQDLEVKIPSVRNEAELKEYERFIAHPFLSDPEIPLSFHAKLDYWRIYRRYHHATGHIEQELEASQRLLDLMDAQGDYVEESPYEYAIILSRMLKLRLKGDEDKFQENFQRFQDFPKRAKKLKRSVEARVRIDSSLIHLEKLIIDKAYQEAEIYFKEVTKTQQQNRKHMEKADIFMCQLLGALVHLHVNKVRPALDMVNDLLNNHRSEVNRELQISLEILNMMVHYHLGNYSLLKYRVKSLSGQLSRSKRLYEPEEEIFRLFARLSKEKTHAQADHRLIFEEAQKSMTYFSKNPLHNKAFQYVDFLAWMERQSLILT